MADYVELWDENNATKISTVGDVESVVDLSWQDQWSGPGRSRLAVTGTNPSADALTPRRHLRHKVNGEYKFTSRILGRSRTLGPDGQTLSRVEVTGNGMISHWEKVKVRARAGVGKVPRSAERPFNWASPELDPYVSPWTTSTVLRTGASTQITLDPNSIWPPEGFPAPVASSAVSWIYSRAPVSAIHPPGKTYYRDRFTLATDDVVVLAYTGDDRVRVFLNGITIEDWTDQYPTWSFPYTYRAIIPCSAGVYDVACEVENYEFSGDPVLGWSPGSLGGLLFAVHRRPSGTSFSASTLLVGSTAATRCLDYPSTVPAPTQGVILGTLVAEAQLRDELVGWSFGGAFSATTDSAGNAWTGVYEYAPRIGDSYAKVLKDLAEYSIDFWFDAVGKVIWVYNRGATRGTIPALTVGDGGNLTALKADESDDQPVNRLVVTYKTGDVLVEDAGSISALGEVYEDYLSVPSVDTEMGAIAAGQAQLGLRSGSQPPTLTAGVRSGVYLDPGYIAFIEPYGTELTVRTVTADVADGRMRYTPELGSAWEVDADRTRTWLERDGDGTLQGRSSVASIDTGSDRRIKQGRITTREVTFSKDNLVVGSQSGDRPFKTFERLTMIQGSLRTAATAGVTSFQVLLDGVALSFQVVGGSAGSTISFPAGSTRVTAITDTADVIVGADANLSTQILAVGDGAGSLTVVGTLAEAM